MAEPLTRTGEGSDEPIGRAGRRLQGALEALETALASRQPVVETDSPSPDSSHLGSLSTELEATRRRGRELEAAVALASSALGRAANDIRRTLDEDAERQGLLDLDGEADATEEPAPAKALEINDERAEEDGSAASVEEDPAA